MEEAARRPGPSLVVTGSADSPPNPALGMSTVTQPGLSSVAHASSTPAVPGPGPQAVPSRHALALTLASDAGSGTSSAPTLAGSRPAARDGSLLSLWSALFIVPVEVL